MHPDPSNSDTLPRGFLRERPWIWIVVVYVTFMALMVGFVVFATRHKEPEVPLHMHGR